MAVASISCVQLGLALSVHLLAADQHADPRMTCCEAGDDRQQVGADGGGESGHSHSAVGFCSRSQVELRCLDCGEDRGGMLGQPAARRRKPDPAPGRLDERSANLAGEHGDLL